ncbi:MAG: type VI secretion system protein TssL, long form [Candidatus Thiodiazotropha sp. (ex Lucina aurantia)]|uniref:Motility protein B n=2 Tax=Candidatus Thiodiazotropha TaxID=1913444 RepID=A0A7Z0VJA8_9GAMM|nr:type VI secretion system protein TssL, long form [Candidatus Thiodiazotropha endolucinida]MBT3011797.1 type VI secretion system protein TssL, long form [Candidatus Thiodiazotropha sp. (ex Lucina pensylvanica)]MBT3016672.1 type VI secretion system protein TssL, long form [Candidatus Thiodiazotropha taylori]MBT3040487.1 type VI secretion system protein TssL, long form [Candidatus Thiodiazotropha sp. (ex Codakia orbicularis)]MBV2103816.1 type VI secretion system protein TssL, long form [Candida
MADECPKCPDGLPPWLATFADLMSLLMCFFVLLLSFAEIDAARFKKMAESMKDAFGVQREIPVMDVVKGTSVVMQEFSPGKPEPTPIEELRQQTTDVEKDFLQSEDQRSEAEEQQDLDIDVAKAAMQAQIEEEVEEQAEELQEMLDSEISEGLLDVETEDTKIIIRIQEKGSFPSGRATLNPDFFEVISKITDVIANTPGKIIVAGHTDNIPISTRRFRSNWELSSARAVTVVHAMLSNAAIDEGRFLIQGYADSQPLVVNDTSENRAQNRRVELVIQRGEDEDSGEVIKASEQ